MSNQSTDQNEPAKREVHVEQPIDKNLGSAIGASIAHADVVYVNTERAWDAGPYLRWLVQDCSELRLSGLKASEANPYAEGRIKLDSVYIDLDVDAQVSVIKDKDGTERIVPQGEFERLPARAGRSRDEAQTQRMTALEAICAPESQQLVLLGEPGGGKTTFVRFLALRLATAGLETAGDTASALRGWTLGRLLPVRVTLREVVAWLDRQEQRGARPLPVAQTLYDFLRSELSDHALEGSAQPLQQHLQAHGGLVLLDGLDEVPDAEKYRGHIKTLVEDFAAAHPLCRIVVTSRPYAYQDKYRRWQLDGFATQSLALFSPDQIAHFVERWYDAVRAGEGLGAEEAHARAMQLSHATREQPHLAALAAYPLLLTMMATLHTSLNTLPEDRADLYDRIVELLLEKWEQRKKIAGAGGQERYEEGVGRELGITRKELEGVLQRVAYEAHRRQGSEQERKATEAANISGAELRAALDPLLGPQPGLADILIRYIKDRAGLLAERSHDTYAFPHRTFQEFLAARHLLNADEAADTLAELARADHAWWQEVFLLAAGYSRNHLDYARTLLSTLCAEDFHSGPISEADAHAALLAAHAAADLRLARQPVRPASARLVKRLQDWLLAVCAQGVLSPIERAEAGRRLSALGDPRPDVSCAAPATVPVEAGEFIMGDNDNKAEKPEHRLHLPDYAVGKYPVTNTQYRRFVDDGGYTDKQRDCWTAAGWEWRESEKIDRPDYWDNPTWNLDNHPVVGVTWYEAVAYCKWLQQTTGRRFHLPTEAEWEKAARGTDGREWPWGNTWDAARTNTRESGVGRTTTVGLFPGDESVYHAFDMAGNVWEWCSSQYASYPYKPEDGREGLEGDDGRVLRGGSWLSSRDVARCADRSGNQPLFRFSVIGFRVAESSPAVGSES